MKCRINLSLTKVQATRASAPNHSARTTSLCVFKMMTKMSKMTVRMFTESSLKRTTLVSIRDQLSLPLDASFSAIID